MKEIVAAALCSVTLFGCSSGDQHSQQQKQRRLSETRAPVIAGYSTASVCRAAISTMFGVDLQIISASQYKNEVYHVAYLRPSDDTMWNSKCKVDLSSGRILWGAVNGRWRTDPRDGSVSGHTTESGNLVIRDEVSGSKTFNHDEINAPQRLREN